MNKLKVVVTGAHSYLGNKVFSHLLNSSKYEVSGFITPWANDLRLAMSTNVGDIIRQDLTKPLSNKAGALISSADRLLHCAWSRKKSHDDAVNTNLRIIENLFAHIRYPHLFYFMSSVAASPKALSTYGLSKWSSASLVASRGGCSLVCGLVIDKIPRGPFKLLDDFVRYFPISIRLKGGIPGVYTIFISDFLDAIDLVIDKELPSSSYRMFTDQPTNFNDLMTWIENKHQNFRFKISLDTNTILKSVTALKNRDLGPSLLYDKILTFLVKDSILLNSYESIPNARIAGINNNQTASLRTLR